MNSDLLPAMNCGKRLMSAKRRPAMQPGALILRFIAVFPPFVFVKWRSIVAIVPLVYAKRITGLCGSVHRIAVLSKQKASSYRTVSREVFSRGQRPPQPHRREVAEPLPSRSQR